MCYTLSGKKWEKMGSDKMYIGEFQYSIDEKGRLSIPSHFRFQLGDKLIVVRGLEKCLYVYDETEWNKVVSKLSELSFTKKSNREFSRMFLSGAFEAEIDGKGRIAVDSRLLSHASLQKECIIIGAGSKIEIWDKAIWTEYFQEHMQIIEEISEELDI